MRRLNGLTLVVVVAILVSAAWAAAAGTATATYVYDVPGSTVPGLSTSLVVDPAATVSITATRAVCPDGGGALGCPGPDGDDSANTTGTAFGGFPLVGAPAWGLLARVGSGPWVQVGSGPTTVSGTGVLEFAVNDDYLADNTGSFTVTVSVTSSTQVDSCKPGWGHGDKNHEHCGPPGLENKPENPGQGHSGGEAQSGGGNGKGQGRPPGR